MLKALLSKDDDYSFLVPCYGFDGKVPVIPDEIVRPDCVYSRFTTRHKLYIPHRGWIANDFDANLLHSDIHARRQQRRPIWKTLRGKETPKPHGGYNVALLVAGKRKFYRCCHRTTKHPKWWYGFMEGIRDCYAAWRRSDGTPLGTPISDDGSNQVYASRSGRGVLYARTASYEHNGSCEGDIITCVRVEFSILDRDPDKDDAMRVNVSHSLCRPWNGETDEPSVSDLDEGWQQLIEEARKGFAENCETVPSEVDEWRKLFLDQTTKLEADRRDYGNSFDARVSRMEWQDALRLVEEPWQMKVVVKHHGTCAEFSSDGGVYTISYETVPEMIRRHDCDEDRRKQLRQMVADYVAPTDNLWNYRGD